MHNQFHHKAAIILLVVCLVGIFVQPVLSAEEVKTGLAEKECGENQGSAGNVELDYSSNAYTLDPKISSVTPYWFLITLDKDARKGLLQFIDNMKLSEKEKASIRLSVKKLWSSYSVTVDRKNRVALSPEKRKTTLAPNEEKNLQVLLAALGSAMEKSIEEQPTIKFAGPQHLAIVKYACDHNLVPDNYGKIAGGPDGTADDPDYWYYPLGQPEMMLNHGYIPSLGIGLAPDNCKQNATQARDKYRHNKWDDAFRSLGHSSHFMVDLGNPMHTGRVTTQIIWDRMGNSIHKAYEDYVENNWDTNFIFSQYAQDTVIKYQVTDPKTSAISLAQYSDNYSVDLVNQVVNNWLGNYIRTGQGKFTLENVPRIRTITQNSIVETTRYTNGLVDYVIRDGIITFTITATAGQHGFINPPGTVHVKYSDSQTFILTPESGYIVDQILVDGAPVTQNPYTFPSVTADHTISATFKSATPAYTAYDHYVSFNMRANSLAPSYSYDLINRGEISGGEQWVYNMYMFGTDSSGFDGRIGVMAYTDGGDWVYESPLTEPLSPGTDYHIVWRYNATQGGELFINDISQGTVPGSGLLPVSRSSSFNIGRNMFSGGGPGARWHSAFNGQMWDVSHYEKDLNLYEDDLSYP